MNYSLYNQHLFQEINKCLKSNCIDQAVDTLFLASINDKVSTFSNNLEILQLKDHVLEIIETTFEKSNYRLEGIGCILELISEAKNYNINTSVYLYDLDDYLYKLYVYSEPAFRKDEDLVKLCAYFYFRFTSINNDNKFRRTVNYEILLLIFLEIKDRITESKFPIKFLPLTGFLLYITKLLFDNNLTQHCVSDFFDNYNHQIRLYLELVIKDKNTDKKNDLLFLSSCFLFANTLNDHQNRDAVNLISKVRSFTIDKVDYNKFTKCKNENIILSKITCKSEIHLKLVSELLRKHSSNITINKLLRNFLIIKYAFSDINLHML